MNTRHNILAASAALLSLLSCRAAPPPETSVAIRHDKLNRLSEANLDELRAGMTEREVRDIIGNPWQLVDCWPRSDRRVYRYVMQRMEMETTFAKWITVDGKSAFERVPVTDDIYRVAEIEFVNGRLATPSAPRLEGSSAGH